MTDDTTIWIRKTTKERLKTQQLHSESMDELINRLLDRQFFTLQQIHTLLRDYVYDDGVKEGDWFLFHSHLSMNQIDRIEEIMLKYGLIGNYEDCGTYIIIRVLMKGKS